MLLHSCCCPSSQRIAHLLLIKQRFGCLQGPVRSWQLMNVRIAHKATPLWLSSERHSRMWSSWILLGFPKWCIYTEFLRGHLLYRVLFYSPCEDRKCLGQIQPDTRIKCWQLTFLQTTKHIHICIWHLLCTILVFSQYEQYRVHITCLGRDFYVGNFNSCSGNESVKSL